MIKINNCYKTLNAYLMMFKLTGKVTYLKQARKALNVLTGLRNEYLQDSTIIFKIGA